MIRKKIQNNNFLLSEDFLKKTEELLQNYEKKIIDWQLEETLRQRNIFLASFAISKAENYALTLTEARENNLENSSVAKVFRELSTTGLKIKDLNPSLLENLHRKLNIKKSQVEIVNSIPALSQKAKANLSELISGIKKNPSVANIFIFHSSLQALQPFKNGNKSLSLILEHFLLRDLGYNQKNLYSTTYYYHQHQDRYQKKMLEALYRNDHSHFAGFAGEALVFSIIAVITGVLQRNKLKFLQDSGLDKNIIRNLKPLVKCLELSFTNFYILTKKRVSRQTFINYLEVAIDSGIVKKRESGKNTYYSLAGNYYEENILPELLKEVRDKINFLPNEFINYLVK